MLGNRETERAGELKVDYEARCARRAISVAYLSYEPILVMDAQFRMISANPAFHQKFQAREETENRLLFELGNGQWTVEKRK
jgi:hypothetical protein